MRGVESLSRTVRWSPVLIQAVLRVVLTVPYLHFIHLHPMPSLAVTPQVEFYPHIQPAMTSYKRLLSDVLLHTYNHRLIVQIKDCHYHLVELVGLVQGCSMM